MEGLVDLRFSDLGSSVRKRRSNTSRRPRNDSQPHSDYYDISSLSSTPPSDNVSKVSSDDNASYGTNGKKKEHNLGKCGSRASSCNVSEDKGFEESNEASNGGSLRGSNEQRHSRVDSRRSSEGVPAPANWKDINKVGQSRVDLDGLGNENKVKKVKLKVGGVIRTIHANSAPDGASAVGSSSTKSSRFSDAAWPQQKLVSQDNSDDNHSFSSDKRRALRGVPWKDFSRSGFNARKMDSSRDRIPEESLSTKQTDKYEPVRKSKRVPKIRSLNNDGYDDDEEIQYLEKLKASKASAEYSVEYEDDEEGGRSKQRKLSKVLKKHVDGLYNMDGIYDPSRSGREGKKFRSGVASQDDDYVEEEEPVSDGEPDMKGKKPRKEFIDSLGDSRKEMTVTTRQRALQTGKDLSSCLGSSLIEFPNGLPPAPPRKQKEKLSEVEQQLKKAEAAQRRRMQVEKAARESEAEAIRKILGQDSSRKKREDKIKKRQEELAQEKAANAMTLASETVRWVMGPSGTVVTFPDEMGLPSIFDSKPCRYPPPREKCAGPSCTNPYKYRDSKSKLPLCSLQCYKAIQEKILPMTAC